MGDGIDFGLFEIIIILGIVGVGIYFLVKLVKSFECGPCKAAGAVTNAISNAAQKAAQKVVGPACTNPTPPQPQCCAGIGTKFFNWLGNLFGLSGGVNAQDKYYNPQTPANVPSTSTGVTPGTGQPCGCATAVLACCSGWCSLNYSQGG